MFVCDFSPLRWSSILLMWADVRTLGSGNDNRDATTWWLWMGLGLTMESTTEGVLLVYDSLVLDKTLCYSWTIVLCFRQCGISFLYGYVWYTVDLHIPNSILFENLCTQRFFIWGYPIIWDVTKKMYSFSQKLKYS